MDQSEIDAFEDALLDEHGELHVIMEELDDELEVRMGQYDPDHRDADNLFTLWKHGQEHTFSYDRIVNWYKPEKLYD